MKRDGRTPDHPTLETIRLMTVERVREGETASAVIASYGFGRTTIYKWLSAEAKPGVGLRALRAWPAPGRPRSLTPRREQQVFRWPSSSSSTFIRRCTALFICRRISRNRWARSPALRTNPDMGGAT